MRPTLGVLALLTVATLAACESPTSAPTPDGPDFTVIGGDNPNGAIVLNRGEASSPFVGTCNFAGRVTTDVTLVRTPNGRGLISCHWENFPAAPQAKAVVIKDFDCFLNFFGFSTTNKSHFVLAKSGVAKLTCTFDGIL